MTHEWKAGDRAMVEIVSVHGDLAVIERLNGSEECVRLDALRPSPALNPHQELRDAVVEAAMKWKKSWPHGPAGGTEEEALWNAVNAFCVAIDPVETVIAAWRSRIDDDWETRVERAIAALEYARGVK
jgi:hypothetical protein